MSTNPLSSRTVYLTGATDEQEDEYGAFAEALADIAIARALDLLRWMRADETPPATPARRQKSRAGTTKARLEAKRRPYHE
jgi:hypothetical protein